MKPDEDFKRIAPDGTVPVTDIDVDTLAEIYDQRDVYLSIYLPTASREDFQLNEGYLKSRRRSIEKAIPEGLEEDFSSTWEMVGDVIGYKPIPGERGRIIFASSPLDFLHVYRIGVPPEERKMVLDTSPFLLPLAKLRDDYMDYGILLMDSQEARFYIIETDNIEKVDSNEIDLMNKHKKGGMSQRRFNRLRRGAISAFVKEVVDDLRDLDELEDLRGIIVAGPGEAKKQLLEELPPDVSEMVYGVEDLDMDMSEGDLVKLGDEISLKEEQKVSAARVEALRAAILKGEPAVYGVNEIKEALEQGRVDTLIILDNASIPGWICEGCQNLQPNTKPPEKCSRCGGPTSRVNVVEELYELAKRTSAEVEFIDESSFLESVGGLGAILRY